MKRNTLSGTLFFLLVALFSSRPEVAFAGPAQEKLLSQYQDQAKAEADWPGAFSADRGRDFFLASPGTGKADTPSCTSCHGASPLGKGMTRAGKEIAPMALSKTPERYSDLAKTEKWFRRNCNSVLGRTCTALEKGDFLSFMIGQ